ncbi:MULTISPECIES: hydantoinase/oxoprolinase family protein [Cytobacillus]|uniref:5-oxoprolinase n=1 Tax=Cytobacillus oceanisediminis 2691 TaxID=1196031 RepID=A0A160MCV9_9BACI|nr:MULTISPECIES: hydantoinase/oxoprolinase family protein [Cytobacillus]AND40574.1 5-oxoprolinase [Cytobacillus oceanisediminis 2691]MCM3243097.1 hydantoinase/oxoprolinase family protein [Cytobacillus oceanisediminis]MDD9311851.1 hydantoinase/oxoprolinase family protein [Cytobacillus firmus]MDK7665339.1 hydantoinase/oxoprolinase family protein [Cytobacillus oceanisediminis]
MRVATDIGGTFTDLVFVDQQGKIGVAKSHTTPPNFEKGVLDVINVSGINTDQLETFIHGTTVIINALTERKGVKTGLITTKGFRDVLEIARGNRPDLFNIHYEKPLPFVPRYLRQEVEERMNYKGEVVQALHKERLKEIIEYFKKEKVEAIAISFLHSYSNPVHEIETVEYIKELWPEVAVTASHEVTREWREYERTSTTVLNSYVKPIASSYVDRLENKLKEVGNKSNKYIMQSNGGTTTFEQSKQTPINMVESGPVAGIYGSAILGNILGEKNIIAFDIGGTTAKCSLIDNGEVKVTTEYNIERTDRTAGYPIKVPVVDIVEIGNGGGSIAWIDEGGSLRVGPQSAGALPGPIAYGKGGTEPTTTDANLVVGRLSPKNFDSEVDMEQVKKAIGEKIAKHFDTSVDEAALGIIRIANSNMLNALKLISVRKGYDPRDFALVAFGGGGSMHAPALAKELGVRKVIVPVATSVFSAWGMLMTDLRHDYIQTFIRRVEGIDFDELNKTLGNQEASAIDQYKKEGVKEESVLFSRFVDLRYVGQEHTVKVPVPNGQISNENMKQVIQKFHEAHEQLYTFKLEESPTEIVNLHLIALGSVKKPELAKLENVGGTLQGALIEVRPVLFEEHGWIDTNVYNRNNLSPDAVMEGPVIVEEQSASTVVYPGQTVTVDAYGNLIIETGV